MAIYFPKISTNVQKIPPPPKSKIVPASHQQITNIKENMTFSGYELIILTNIVFSISHCRIKLLPPFKEREKKL